MKDCWYADNRDLVKWGVLLRLAEIYGITTILHVAFYRPSEFGTLIIDDQPMDLPSEVTSHFRNLNSISSISTKVRVTVFRENFVNRATYLIALSSALLELGNEGSIVFLDPDTGLEPNKPKLEHVLNSEVHAVWDAMKTEDVLAFYQHQTNRNGQEWIEPKRIQLAQALAVDTETIKIASGPKIARDVVFYYRQKG
jgi:hypothetical protein